MLTLIITLLPTVLRLVNWMMDRAGATAEEKRKVTELITASKNDSLTPIQIKDEFNELRERLKARMKEKKP